MKLAFYSFGEVDSFLAIEQGETEKMVRAGRIPVFTYPNGEQRILNVDLFNTLGLELECDGEAANAR